MPQRGRMFEEMQAAVRKVKLAHPGLHTFFVAYCLALTATLVPTFLWWYYCPGLWISCFAALIFELYFLNVFHTRHHQGGRIYRNDTLHRLTTPLYDFIDATWGYYPYAWRFNHHVKHHVFTNDSYRDTVNDSDVPSMWPIVRSCHDQPRRWWHKAQTFYWPLLMPFTAVNFPVNNILTYGGSVFHFVSWIFIMFVIPVLLHGWPILLESLFIQGLTGASLAYKFAVSHAHNNLVAHTTSKDVYDDVDEWLTAQIRESMNYGGFWTTCIFGGINMQVEHHIAPALDPPLYYYMSLEIRRISHKYGIKYTNEPSLFHAVWEFHRHLFALGWSV